ncbi:MAG: hypothetical protein A3G32_03145 [Deltaproteobacteria bacterium RIFCSPLOWO2_12_FULL_40_28]|nr:MAG: hypothetical protein A3C45_01830 [Deltaproteobacteria bacterium RIFCSPHIGHO2_02_FULL_40_28]OGQ19528.1 MAG: hypothetical protein A3E27_02030 [Deltaproteobacteria bacterium RIFCSPHIGHO2_12_FULL_40_32]OGQ40002.1 MAG: hypothetical protein A3I69_07995 [Deltaproteobacteria bacterium RIFCSPLOWO2_02_FULL_40_36]OGQ54439.1 MAG: hypothetical protein A3G32_03145 [Deltaproteobacteria bacterium RIFCSPLOWO2_12_FULL_40_28]
MLKDLTKKMVFLTGPRQVGKTWLALDISKDFKKPTYLSFDNPDHRQVLKGREWLPDTDLLVLDEIHKMRGWKNYLKGVYDTKPESLSILVTGSARLETFRQAGDSLAGRFFVHHLMPFCLNELPNSTLEDQQKLIECGGFPEPFLAPNQEEASRWQSLYFDSLMREEIFEFQRIFELKAIRLILERLQRNVGSPVSYQSLAEDVQISPQTVKRYIQILEDLYIIFRVIPYSQNIARSLLKEPKIYFYNTGFVVGDIGAHLENFVAVSLLTHLFEKSDLLGDKTQLANLRTKEKKEVDFCLVVGNKIKELIECKLTDDQLAPSLRYFCNKYHLKGTQLVKTPRIEKQVESIQIRASFHYLKGLGS